MNDMPLTGPIVGSADPALDQKLNDELTAFNTTATQGTSPAQELTVRIRGDEGEVVAGLSGWTWGRAAGIALTWVHADFRRSGLGAELLNAFEEEARRRECSHVFVTSFTFQAPDFYVRHGYEEILRWSDIPVTGADDIHMRKDL